MKHKFQTQPSPVEFFKTNDVHLAYDTLGQEESKTQILFLINGFQRTRQDFRALRQKIVAEVPHIMSVAFDNRYCGQTKVIHQTGNPSLLDFANDALALLKHCIELYKIEKVHVLGISMGGMIAQILATLPECPPIQTLFLVSTTAGGALRVWPDELHLQKNAPIQAARVPHTEERIALYFGKKFLKSSPLLFKMFVQNMQKIAQSLEAMESFSSQAKASQNYEGVADFKAIKAKNVVIISGDEDKIMPLKNSQILVEHINGSHLIVYPEVGHLILIENPNEFVHDIVSYLKMVPAVKPRDDIKKDI